MGRGIVIINKLSAPSLNFPKFFGISLAAKMPDERTVIKIGLYKRVKYCEFALYCKEMAYTFQYS